MEFWGVEVKPGESVKCGPNQWKYVNVSQASLGESKGKENENVLVSVKFDDKKIVLGTLSLEKCAQISFDIVFEKGFELSHTSKNASVYFLGYSSKDEDNSGKPLVKQDQGKPSTGKAKAVKGESSAAKKAGPAKVDKPTVEEDEESEDDEDDDDSEEDSEDDEDLTKAMSDSDDEEEDESSEEEDEATHKKAAPGKRPAGSAPKTPVPGKKAKVVTPPQGQKTGGEGKKGGHVATPHPAKQAGKTPANNNDKSKQQTPKSAGSVTCKSCSRIFNSENALQAHSKAKHG